MKKIFNITIVFLLMLSTNAFAKSVVELYKSPTCGCCSQWAAIMKEKGYEVNIHLMNNRDSVKDPFDMPSQLSSCHTAVIDGYMVEGHVPEADIARLLEERPSDISGIAVPGMPQYSPGMASRDKNYQDFNVVAFNKEGQMSLYRKY
ncbi:CopG family transcriptional regulator [Vibrio sp. HA2012]|uniref:DUF411 domain-containing protein n=1 Tax=Vibrio sp. HA2012 TaxID=1971595 RepID=UPI000C2C0594|nr:DUF411 domain-containing protein [Vibrio sp. HA2012]PJC87517.1 CopG family transcriptional regulator [Vibrio sp. HA2012]